MNQQRRIFRGRGGPTDGRLPKHNAKRRKQPAKPQTNKYDADEILPPMSRMQVLPPDTASDPHATVFVPPESSPSDDSEVSVQDGMDEDDNDDEEETHTPQVDPSVHHNMPAPTPADSPALKEVKHLVRRVKNVQESIQLSRAIVNPQTYQETVLNAVSNCVNEWRSIATHYHPDSQVNATADTLGDLEFLSDQEKRPAALLVFGLIQHALQSGPLAGAKPGYFKRCGSAVAQMALDFLTQVTPHEALGLVMGFSTKQLEALQTWRQNAEKAAIADKPPSRTALKKQQGKKGGKKASKK
eukprot:Nitzschia sp. Nitz4//scaffold20_size174350//78601//79497//NITZ4_002102-RA/size174350-processed-gene-0.24-mRNA-1//1//CDS//3329541809//4631//frame0